ncbi:MAG: hypothetical protein HC901_00090 [Bdellovibrionaceae bacterium]|nr:hypothetical protein [Pseudobdellovibrionaceae bacterium]
MRQATEADVEGDVVVLTGTTKVLQTQYQARIAVDIAGGRKEILKEGEDAVIVVKDADAATVFLTIGTNYQLEPNIYLTSTDFHASSKNADMPPEFQDKYKKLEGKPLPLEAIIGRMNAARAAGWDMLKAQHLADFQPLMERCVIDLGGVKSERPTSTVRGDKKSADAEMLYLQELFFQYGRYLLVSSSRPGTLPAGCKETGTGKSVRRGPGGTG